MHATWPEKKGFRIIVEKKEQNKQSKKQDSVIDP
jgi:hypothetical protein